MDIWVSQVLVTDVAPVKTYVQQFDVFRDPGDRCATESARAIEFNKVCCADGRVKKNRAFCVSVIKREYFIVCDTDGQKSAWVSAISEALRCRPR